MEQAEQFILTISANGYGKRTSSYEYRVTGRGGKGIVAMAVNPRNGELVASMPVEPNDQIMLVTDGGQLIRCPVAGIRVIGRGTQGVIVFNTAETEKVVSVERIGEVENGDGEDEAAPRNRSASWPTSPNLSIRSTRNRPQGALRRGSGSTPSTRPKSRAKR